MGLTKWWLIGILPILPFQLRVADALAPWNSALSAFIQYLDEITVSVFFPIAIVLFYKERSIPKPLYIILIAIIAVGMSGMVSGIINSNLLFITALGTFDYIKNFLVIFIYAAFFRDLKDFKRVYGMLLTVAVLCGAVAFLQEVWALSSRYILGNNIYDRGLYILRSLPSEDKMWVLKDFWRMGIYRAPSLTHHPNSLGLYCLLILNIYLFTVKKVNPAIFLSLFTGVFVSVSRMIYTGFVLIAGIQFLKGRKWLAPLAILIISLLFFHERYAGDITVDLKEDSYFRHYAKNKAIEVWKDHPFFGAGPGMFGGVISIIFQSPVYEKYSFSQKWYDFMKPFRSLDQFWHQLLAETGIIGTLAFAVLLISLFAAFFISKQQASSDEVKGIFIGLIVGSVFILIYSLGSGLNMTLFLYTFSALAGMAFGTNENTPYK